MGTFGPSQEGLRKGMFARAAQRKLDAKTAAELKAKQAAEQKEFTRKATPGVKLTTERAARGSRGKPSLIGGPLKETLG